MLEVRGPENAVTDTLIDLAVAHFSRGRRVLFVTTHAELARAAFDRFEERLPPEPGTTFRRAVGSWSATGAGSIWFITGRPGTAGRGCEVDTLILNDADFYSDKSLASLMPTIHASAAPLMVTGRSA